MKKEVRKKQFERKLFKLDSIIKKGFDVNWILQITIMAFFITIFFSFFSDIIMRNVNIFIGIFIIIIFIMIGVVFDMIGISVASASDKPFHSMSSKKIIGAKMAIKLIKKAEKVSAFCNDVIGDICNIISGSAGLVVATNLASKYEFNVTLMVLIVTSFIAALTIGGKAAGKSIAINKSEVILYEFAKFCSMFHK